MSDLVTNDGYPLYVGQVHFKKCKKKFMDFVTPRDIKGALCLLCYLFLKSHLVSEEKSYLFNSAMLCIKASLEGQDLHTNSIEKPNKMFAHFVIDFLAMSFLFDSFHVHNSLFSCCPCSLFQETADNQQTTNAPA